MPRLRNWYFLALVLLIILGSSPAAANEQDDKNAIRAAARDWIVAFKAGDIDALMALYAPDAFVALHGQPAMRGKGAIRDYFAPKLGTSEVEFLLDFEEIQVHGDVAHLVSQYWYVSVPKGGGDPLRDAGRSALIYKKAGNGRWLIYLDIDQQTPDVTFPPPRDVLF
ncbi:MAG: YybH family protein [Gammaproteobacteria bacterium]